MGPDTRTNPSLPSRPKFSWDTRNPPWTDGRGNQEEYARAVTQWATFQDGLPDSNSNKIGIPLRGICLIAQLFGRAKDLCMGLTAEQLASSDGVKLIVSTIYQRDPISVVSEVYKDFNDLVFTRRGQNEAFKNFESRYAAQLSNFNANGSSVTFPEALSALMLLSNAGVDDGQRISIISSVATGSSDTIEDGSANDAYISSIRYSSVASILRQCDRVKSSNHSDPPTGLNTVGPNMANTNRYPRRNRYNDHPTPNPNNNRQKTKLTPAQLNDLKA